MVGRRFFPVVREAPTTHGYLPRIIAFCLLGCWLLRAGWLLSLGI